jgi:DNA sulfur modification protein DndB
MASEAKNLTFVPVYDDLLDPKSFVNQIGGGYQRPGDIPRMRQFSKYLDLNPLAIVPPVLLSTRQKWSFQPDGKGDIGTLTIKGQAAIIDGQHRLGGFIHRWENVGEDREIDFVAYEGLTSKREAEVFNTINGKTKSVPKGLGKVIEDSWSTQVALKLRNDRQSPFFQKIFVAKKSEIDGALFNLSSIDKEIQVTFSHGAFSDLVEEEDVETLYKIIATYWHMIAESFEEEWEDINLAPNEQSWKLLELTGVIAWSRAASEILGPSFDSKKRQMDWSAVRDSVYNIASSGELDLSKDGEFADKTGIVGGGKIHKQIQRILARING